MKQTYRLTQAQQETLERFVSNQNAYLQKSGEGVSVMWILQIGPMLFDVCFTSSSHLLIKVTQMGKLSSPNYGSIYTNGDGFIWKRSAK